MQMCSVPARPHDVMPLNDPCPPSIFAPFAIFPVKILLAPFCTFLRPSNRWKKIHAFSQSLETFSPFFPIVGKKITLVFPACRLEKRAGRGHNHVSIADIEQPTAGRQSLETPPVSALRPPPSLQIRVHSRSFAVQLFFSRFFAPFCGHSFWRLGIKGHLRERDRSERKGGPLPEPHKW